MSNFSTLWVQMPRRLQNFLCLTLLCSLVAIGCGPLIPKKTNDFVLSVPDYISTPHELSRVTPGSLDIVTGTPAGAFGGPVLLSLHTEPGASISYGFSDFTKSGSNLTATKYKDPVLVFPPFKVWSQATKDGKSGKVKTFTYTLDAKLYPATKSYEAPKLPSSSFSPGGLTSGSTATTYKSGSETSVKGTMKADGKNTEWTSQGRLFLRDSTKDVPPGLEHIDISWMQVGETDVAIIVAMAFVGETQSAKKIAYGFEIGTSGITTSTFGSGANYLYKAELRDNGLRILDTSDDDEPKTIKHSANSVVVRDEIIEFHILKSDLDQLDGTSEIVIRGYAVDWTPVTTVFDRADPLYIRSAFDVTSTTVSLPGGRFLDFNFMTESDLANDYTQTNLEITQSIIQELEDFNGMPLFGTGYTPAFYVGKEENGYAGLNTTDRGILTTMGPFSSRLLQTQLMAHEFAHYQNARNSNITQRWIQEGMSEWTSERILSRLFPKRAVYNSFKTLRFNRYFDGITGGAESIPLDDWGTDKSDVGYEKSLMAMDMLAAELGEEALHAAFQYGKVTSMDSKVFMNFLSDYTGKDVSYLFDFWVFEGTATDGFSPEELYKDDDGDELMNIDETLLGLSKDYFDTDGDGLTDGEEYFRDSDPKTSVIKLSSSAAPLLTTASSTDSGALFRLGGHIEQAYLYSLNPYDTTPTTSYDGPRFFRAPYSISVSGSNGSYVVTRPNYVGGSTQSSAYQTDLILPDTPKSGYSYASGISTGDSVGISGSDYSAADTSEDLPSWLSAYDITKTTVKETSTSVTIVIDTESKPDDLGSYGDYVVAFDNLDWSSTDSGYTRRYALTITGGSVFWHTYEDSVESSSVLLKDATITYGSNLTITLQKALIGDWGTNDDRQVCAWTSFELFAEKKHLERAGCVILESPDFTRSAGTVASYYGSADHTLEVFIENGDYNSTRASDALTVGLSALREFEKALARPSWDRSLWRLHLYYNDTNAYAGTGSLTSGAWLAAPASLTDMEYEYLIVEQLARLAAADSLEREETTVPYFIQELYVQWLASSAMYEMYPTKLVHAFHASRLDDYMCYTPPTSTCTTIYTDDIYLSDWNSESISGSSASAKSLMLTLMLNAEIGTGSMAIAMNTFTNGWPSSTELKNMLKSIKSGSSSEIDDLWEMLVDGSGSESNDITAIRTMLTDGDGDDLYKFEEDKLGKSDGSADTYLN